MAERAFCFVKGIGAMKSALRRALSIANALEAFKWAGSPSDDPDGIYFSTQYLRELAIKFRAAAKHLHHPQLRDAFERLSLDVDGHNFDEGVDLHAELLGIVGTLHDFVEEWGTHLVGRLLHPLFLRRAISMKSRSIPRSERVCLNSSSALP
jgi:hypothetical protein